MKIRSLARIGIQPHHSFGEQQKIQMSNLVGFAMFVIDMMYGLPSLTFNVWGGLFGILCALSGLWIVHFNSKFCYKTARIVAIIGLNIQFTFYAVFQGSEVASEYLLYPTIMAVMLFFDEKKYILPLFLLCICCFFLSKASFSWWEKPPFWTEFVHVYYYPNLVVSFLLIYAFFTVFKSEQQNYQQQIESQNNELNQQKEEILMQRDDLAQKNKEIDKKNKQTSDSIKYALRIQSAILPSQQEIKKNLPESFIFFSPKDIVSGDFYWFEKIGNQNPKLFFAVADCTGHGVSGALMSMLGANTLSQIVNEEKIVKPNEILLELDSKIRKQLKQNEKGSDLRDGMDMILCLLENQNLYFASAQRPLWLFRNADLMEYKGDKTPIGSGFYENKTFQLHHILLQKNDQFFIFSDGIVDQFDSTDKKRFGSKALKELLSKISQLAIETQENYFAKTINEWKGNNKQTDDMLLLSIKIT